MRDAELREALGGIFLFEALDGEALDAIAAFSRFVQIGRGEALFDEGDVATAFYAVLEGRVKIVRTLAGGAEVVVHVQRAGDLVAEAAIYSLQRYPAACVALDDALLVRVPAAEFTALLLRRADIALAVMHGYSRRLRAFVETIGILSSHDVKVRLARWLIASLRAAPASGAAVVELSGTRRDLAAHLGTVPETLSRAFSALRAAALIDPARDSVRILDLPALRRLADGT